MTQLLISEALNRYAEHCTTDETPVLSALNRETNMKISMPQMLSGKIQGALLQMLSHMIKPEKVLEIGTFTGYSAICLAQGLKENGHLHTIDINEELEDMCRKYFREAWVDQKITQHIGRAADIIPAIDERFDLVFIDADKENYSLYFDLVFDKVTMGGFIIADNVLYNGEVILPDEEQSRNARAMHAFNEKLCRDPRIERVLLPVRDGLLIMRKTAEV